MKPKWWGNHNATHRGSWTDFIAAELPRTNIVLSPWEAAPRCPFPPLGSLTCPDLSRRLPQLLTWKPGICSIRHFWPAKPCSLPGLRTGHSAAPDQPWHPAEGLWVLSNREDQCCLCLEEKFKVTQQQILRPFQTGRRWKKMSLEEKHPWIENTDIL